MDSPDSTAIYANRDSDFEDNSSKTPQHRKDYPEPSKPSSANETGSSDHAVFFPGIEELDAQMSEGFLVDQRQSADSQSTANSQDIDHNDPHKVRMDMATICMEMNDNETAREILLEIIHEADEPVRTEAQGMLDSLNNQLSD
jgi:FimV-like protein